MKTRLKMFAILVVLGFSSSMLFLYTDWGLYGECLEEGLFPSFSDTERCSRLFESTIPDAFAMCIVNEDWPEAPCLDLIANGWYDQDQVDRWSDYYSYKGPIFMEAKYLELSEAIKEDRIEEWTEQSVENRNVYEYYFFSGRAPNTGEYTGSFDVITVNEEDKQTFPPPLKQIKAGVALVDIKCNEGKHLVYKYNRVSAACVTDETEGKLLSRGWAALRLGMPATDNVARDLCHFYEGKWINEHNECENLEYELHCSRIGGVYDECASACRNAPDYPNVACNDNCVEVCSVESSSLEDIKNHPVVEAFYAKYNDAHEEVRSDHVSYFAGNEDDFLVRMNLYFDEHYELDHIDFHCYFQREHQFEVPQEDIISKLEKYECIKSET